MAATDASSVEDFSSDRCGCGCDPVTQVNGRPLELVQPEGLQFKLQEPILLLGKDRSASSRNMAVILCLMNAFIHRPV